MISILILLLIVPGISVVSENEHPEYKTKYSLSEENLENWAIPFDSGMEVEVSTGSSKHGNSGFCVDFMPMPSERNDVRIYAPFSGYILQTSASIYNAPNKRDIYSAAGTQAYGNFIHLIDPASGYSVIMAHLQNDSVPFDTLQSESWVEKGTYLGLMGGTTSNDALATIIKGFDVHLHMEIRIGTDSGKPTFSDGTKIGSYEISQYETHGAIFVGNI